MLVFLIILALFLLPNCGMKKHELKEQKQHASTISRDDVRDAMKPNTK